MINIRRWSARHACRLEKLYVRLERALIVLYRLCRYPTNPFFERCVFVLEKLVKQFLFDSKMCGSCVLGSTGMTCPMNCPKKMRNGPCGGVRQNGRCEIDTGMPCVWLDAFVGSLQIEQGIRILAIQAPVDHRQQNTSSWLRELRRLLGMES